MIGNPGEHDPAMLTDKQRLYLLDMVEIEGAAERTRRNRIRERVLRSIQDFLILDIGLSEDDHAKIFEKGTGGDIRSGGDYSLTTEEDRDREFSFYEGVNVALKFFYNGMRSQGNDLEDMETLLEGAIGRAESPGGGWHSNSEYTMVSATVDIELEEEHSVDKLYKHLQEGERLTKEEIGKLAQQGRLTPQDLEEIYRREKQFREEQMERIAEKYADEVSSQPNNE